MNRALNLLEAFERFQKAAYERFHLIALFVALGTGPWLFGSEALVARLGFPALTGVWRAIVAVIFILSVGFVLIAPFRVGAGDRAAEATRDGARLENGVRIVDLLWLSAVAYLALILLSVAQGVVTAVHGAILVLLGTLVLVFTGLFLAAVGRGDRPRVESNWGGLGGGVGGWSMSPAAIYLFVTLLFVTGTAGIATLRPDEPDADPTSVEPAAGPDSLIAEDDSLEANTAAGDSLPQ